MDEFFSRDEGFNRSPLLPAVAVTVMVRTSPMHEVKDTARALVRIGYDGRVHKSFRGHQAKERFENEVLVLKYLEKQGCTFVPKLLETDPDCLKIVTDNCGTRVDHISNERVKEVFAELEHYGVRHDDAFARNITYRASDGRFCIIDFEFATLLDGSNNPPMPGEGNCG